MKPKIRKRKPVKQKSRSTHTVNNIQWFRGNGNKICSSRITIRHPGGKTQVVSYHRTVDPETHELGKIHKTVHSQP